MWGGLLVPPDTIWRLGGVQMSPTPEHVDDLTITIRNLDAGRGAFDFAWGPQVATATFTVR